MSNLLLETGDNALLEDSGSPQSVLLLDAVGVNLSSIPFWTAGVGWSVVSISPGGAVAYCDGTQTTSSSLKQTVSVTAGTSYELSIDIIGSPVAGTLSISFDGITVISSISASGTHTVSVAPSSNSAVLAIVADSSFNGYIDNVSLTSEIRSFTNWMRSTLNIQGRSDTGTPNTVKVNYTIPLETTGAWETDSFTTALYEVGYD